VSPEWVHLGSRLTSPLRRGQFAAVHASSLSTYQVVQMDLPLGRKGTLWENFNVDGLRRTSIWRLVPVGTASGSWLLNLGPPQIPCDGTSKTGKASPYVKQYQKSYQRLSGNYGLWHFRHSGESMAPLRIRNYPLPRGGLPHRPSHSEVLCPRATWSNCVWGARAPPRKNRSMHCPLERRAATPSSSKGKRALRPAT